MSLLRIPSVLAACALGAVLTAPGPGSADEAPAALPIVAKVHADWCGTCTRLEPTWQRLEAELDGRARLVVFDVTDRDAVERSSGEAERLGLSAFLDANKSKTGTIAVLDGKTLEVIQSFKGELDFEKYAAAVAEASGS